MLAVYTVVDAAKAEESGPLLQLVGVRERERIARESKERKLYAIVRICNATEASTTSAPFHPYPAALFLQQLAQVVLGFSGPKTCLLPVESRRARSSHCLQKGTRQHSSAVVRDRSPVFLKWDAVDVQTTRHESYQLSAPPFRTGIECQRLFNAVIINYEQNGVDCFYRSRYHTTENLKQIRSQSSRTQVQGAARSRAVVLARATPTLARSYSCLTLPSIRLMMASLKEVYCYRGGTTHEKKT